MRRPKHEGAYPDRDIDCQEAVSQEVADLIEQASLSGASEADAASAIADTGIPGVQSILHEAAKAGWSVDETENAIKLVAAGMYRGITGIDE
ncbi:hypothetical protein FG152_24475 [Ochrobactrum sp. XJ1]|nr:hypothetical protein [Ochrobactrum sp. XJ1]